MLAVKCQGCFGDCISPILSKTLLVNPSGLIKKKQYLNSLVLVGRHM